MSRCFVYMVRCADDSLYTGWTTDVDARVRAHNQGRGAKYTRSRRPVELVYREALPDRRAAQRREWALKQLDRGEKLRLVREREKYMRDIAIRPFQPGEASYISWLHMKTYGQVYGFRGVFESYVLKGLIQFLDSPYGGRLWVAAEGETVVGSIAIIRTEDQAAQLRWFVIDPDYQGRGIGRRLMDTAMEFVAETEYTTVRLWTIDMLTAARHLYEDYGFVKLEAAANAEWSDHVLTEELWELRR